MYSQFPYPYPQSDFAQLGGIASAVLAVVAVVYLLAIGVSILMYILYALGLYTIAERRQIRHPWLAWVPFGNLWILGSISDQYQYVSQGLVRSRRKILVGLQIAMSALALVMVGVSLVAMAQAFSGIGNSSEAMGIGFALIFLVIYLAAMVLSILLTVFHYICLYNLFASCDPNSKVAFLLLSIFLGVTLPILLFISRKKDLGMPPRRTDPVYEQPIDPVYEQPIDPPAFEE